MATLRSLQFSKVSMWDCHRNGRFGSSCSASRTMSGCISLIVTSRWFGTAKRRVFRLSSCFEKETKLDLVVVVVVGSISPSYGCFTGLLESCFERLWHANQWRKPEKLWMMDRSTSRLGESMGWGFFSCQTSPTKIPFKRNSKSEIHLVEIIWNKTPGGPLPVICRVTIPLIGVVYPFIRPLKGAAYN